MNGSTNDRKVKSSERREASSTGRPSKAARNSESNQCGIAQARTASRNSGEGAETELQDRPAGSSPTEALCSWRRNSLLIRLPFERQVLDYLHDLFGFPRNAWHTPASQEKLRVRNLDPTVHLSDNRHPGRRDSATPKRSYTWQQCPHAMLFWSGIFCPATTTPDRTGGSSWARKGPLIQSLPRLERLRKSRTASQLDSLRQPYH